MVKKKKKLQPEWKNRKITFLSAEEKKNQKYCLHAWNTFDCDGHGKMYTHSHVFPRTDNGWTKLVAMAREYADKGYTVSITKAGVN